MNKLFMSLFNKSLSEAENTKELDFPNAASIRGADMLRTTWTHICQRVYPLATSSLVLKMCIGNLTSRMKRSASLPQLKCYIQLVAEDRLIIIFVPETIEDVLIINSSERGGHRTTTQTLNKNSLEVLSESGDDCADGDFVLKESLSLNAFPVKVTAAFTHLDA